MFETIFIVSVFAIIYAYALYPLSLVLIRKMSTPFLVEYDSDYEPSVTILITVHNEEDKIEKKLANTIAVDYPKDKLQILVASDASTDNTDDLVRHFASKHKDYNITIERNSVNGGKEAAQKNALKVATGDVVIITDASIILKLNVVKCLVGHFADERVGAVDGKAVMINDKGEISGEGAYLKYENFIRAEESMLGSTVSLGGCLFAARRSLLQKDFSPSLQSDFRTALMAVTHGYQAIIDPQAVAMVPETKDPAKESNRKHRTVVRGINNLMHHLYLLNPFKYGLFAYQLFCHKLLKWLVPFFMIAAFISNAALAIDSNFWLFVWLGQVLFYTITAISMNSNGILKLIYFFVMSNAAILHAWISYIKGERFVSWKPTER